MEREWRTPKFERKFQETVKSRTIKQAEEKEFYINNKFSIQQENPTLLKSEQCFQQYMSLHIPKERRSYHSLANIIDEFEIYNNSNKFGSYSSHAATSSSSEHSPNYDDSDKIIVPQGSMIRTEVEGEGQIHTLFFIEDWIGEEDEPMHEHVFNNRDVLCSRCNNKKNLQNMQNSSCIPSKKEKSTLPSSVTHVCKNHDLKKPLLNKYEANDPYYDFEKTKDLVTSISPICRTLKLPLTIKHISPVHRAPKLPLIVKEKCNGAHVDKKTFNGKDTFSDPHETDIDNLIAILPKESVINIQKRRIIELENKTDFTTNVKIRQNPTSNHNHLLKKKDYENYSQKDTDITTLGFNMLNLLVKKMTDTVNQVIDLSAANEDIKHDRKQVNNMEHLGNICEKKDITVVNTKTVIDFPKFHYSRTCDRFPISQQYRNAEVLQELIQLVTTTISQLKLITHGTIISDYSSTNPTVLISTSAGPATATVLSNPQGMGINNENESFLDFDFMYRKICKAEAGSEVPIVDQVESHISKATTQLPSLAFGHEFGDYVGSTAHERTISFPDDLISFDDNSLLLGKYAAVDEHWNCSSPSLLDEPIEDFNQSINLLPSNFTLQMLGTTSNSHNNQTGSDAVRISSLGVLNNEEGVSELIGKSQTHRNYTESIQHNSPNYVLQLLPASKETENEDIPLLQRTPHNLARQQSFKASNQSLKNDFSSAINLTSSKTFITHSHLCEKYSNKHVGLDSAPIMLQPESPIFSSSLEELKKCVYDPKQYLQRCIAISATTQSKDHMIVSTKMTDTNAKAHIDGKKINDLREISSKNSNQKADMSFQQLTSISRDHACSDNKIPQENIGVKIKKNTSKLSHKMSAVTSEFKELLNSSSQDIISVSSKAPLTKESKEKSFAFSMPGSKNKSSNEIKGGFSKIEVSCNTDNKENIKQKNKKRRNHYGTKEELILVPIAPSPSTAITNRNGETCNIKKHINPLEEEEEEEKIIHWFKTSRSKEQKNDTGRLSMNEFKRKKSAFFNVRKGHFRHGRRNQTLKFIMRKIQALLQPTDIDLTDPSASKIKPASQTMLDILITVIKEGFLKGVSTASKQSLLSKIQNPNSHHTIHDLLDKPDNDDLYGTYGELIQIKNDMPFEKPENVIDVSNNASSTAFCNAKFAEISQRSENVLCKDMFYGQSSSLATYLGEETSSQNLETQRKNSVWIAESSPTIKIDEKLPGLQTDFPIGPALSNDTQTLSLDLDEIYCPTKPEDKNNCILLHPSVFDTTSDLQISTTIPTVTGELSETSPKNSVCSKPPPHPRSAKKRNERTNNSALQKKELLSISDLKKTNYGTKLLKNIKPNYKNSCQTEELDLTPTSLTQNSAQDIQSAKSSFCHEQNTCFAEKIEYPISTVEYKNSLYWTKCSSQMVVLDNSPTNVQNTESTNVCKKLERMSMKTTNKDARCTWEVPGHFFQARNYSQKYRSSLCNGRCCYYDPIIYGRSCSPCRILKAGRCFPKYMKPIIGDTFNKSYHDSNLAMRNQFYKETQMNTKNMTCSMKEPFKMTQMEKRTETASFEIQGRKEQGNTISPLQVLTKHKKKETPVSLNSFSAKHTNVSSSTEYYTDNSRRSSNSHTVLSHKRVQCREKPYDRPETAINMKPRNRLSSLALPTTRYIKETKHRYKNVLERKKLKLLDEMMILKRNEEWRARMSRHHNQEYNSETSSSSSQDYESSTSSRTSDEEPVNIAPSMTITNKILQRSDKSTEVIDLNTIAYDEKTLIGIDRSIKDPKLEINNDVDTVTFGKYVFIGVGKHFETSKKSVSPLKENNSLHLNTGRQYSVNDTCEISRPTVDFSVKRTKTDKSIPYEKGIQLRAASMKPKDPLKTILGKENSQSDNMICPQNKTYRIEESPMEKIATLTLKNKDTTDTKAEIKKTSIIYNDQKKASDEKVSNGQGEICSNCLSYIGRKTFKWLEFDLLNTHTDSRTLSTSSSSQLQLKDCKSQLERKMSEGSNVGSKDWKKTMKVTDNTELSLNLNNVPTSFLNSVPKEFLRSSDSTTSEFLGDSCFTKESCLSMENKIHETCVKALINKIETLLYETDVSDFSDSGTSCMHTQSSLSKKFTTPISISSLSNTDNSTISKKEKYQKPERNNDSIICKRTSRTEVKETNLSTVNKVSEETIPAMQIISKRQNTAPEVINRNNNTNYIDNNICMVYNKDEDYIFQLPKKEHESIKDKASYKNLLKIKVVNNGNNLTLSFISQHRQITPSKEYSPLPHVYCTNFHSSKKIAMHKYFVMNNYKIYKANMFCCIIEEYLCIIWEQIRLIECSEKIILALDRYSRYASEQLNEITANQIFCLEFPLPSFDIQISLIVPKVSEHDFERKRTCGASFHKMLTSGLEPAPSSIEMSSGSTGAEACADYHTSSCFDLSIAGINPMNIIPRSETLENLCSSLSTNSDMLLTPSKANILSSNNKSSDMLVQEDIHQLRDSTNHSNDDLSLNQSKIFESDKYQDCTVSQQNEQHETSIYDLTTPDTVNGIIAAFTHIPNGTAILSSTSHTLVQPLQNVFPPSNNLEDLLEALSNFNSVVNAEEESFQSDLSSLENYLERMTSNTTVDSSYEEVGRSQVMSIQHIGHEVKTLEIPREFEGLQEYYLVTKCSTNELQTFAEIKEEMPNLLEDTMNKLKNEHYRSSVYTNIQSLSLHQADELSVKYDNGSIKTLQEEILENYLPDEDTRIMLQNILSEVLEDVVDVEANQEFMDAESIRSLQNDCGNMSETIMKLFPPSLENKSIPITDIVDQIKKDLILDERIKNKINILDNIIHKDSVTTQKLVQRITSELSLIPREEMELFMAQIFGLDLATFTLDSLYHDMNNEAELDVQCTMYNIECEIEASSKNSDLTISQTTLDQLDKETSQIEQLLEVVTEKSCNIAGEVSKQYSGDNLKDLESNCSPAMPPQMHGSSEQGLKSTIEPNESEWTELYHDSLERLAAASEFATFETINDELKVENVDEREGNILEPALEENILMIHSVLNAEEQVLSGAGDGIVTPRNALHRHESHFSAWAVLSLEDMVRNTPIHHPLNVQTSSLSVVVSNSVADYSTNSAVTSISDMSAFSHEELNSFIKIQEKDTSSRVDTLKSEKSMGTKIMQSIEYIKLNENSTTMKETSKTNVTVSRRTKAFATIYFILFSLIFGGLAMHSQCQ